jgi:hypothetical protein
MEEIVEGWRARTGPRWRGKKDGRVKGENTEVLEELWEREDWRTGKTGKAPCPLPWHEGPRVGCSKQSKAIYESTYTSSRRSL